MSLGGRRGGKTGRIETFSDAVFAITMTLLVIELSIPHPDRRPADTTLFEALVGQWPSYLGYLVSFIVVGALWADHRNRFRYIARSDNGLIFLNILFLMGVAFIPFPTALLADYLQTEERTTAVAVYSGALALTAIIFTLLWLYVVGNGLLDHDLGSTTIRAMTRRYIVGMLVYIVAFGLAFVSVTISLALIVGLAVLFVSPEPDERTSKSRRRRRRAPER